MLFFVSCFCQQANAQNFFKNRFSDLQYNYFLGRIVKHTADFKPTITQNTQWHEWSIYWKTDGKKAWHFTHRLPKLSLSLLYAQYGDAAIFGSSFSALAGVQYAKQQGRFTRQLHLKFGLNYSTKPYNRFTNPTNNAVGAHLNLTAKIDFGYTYTLSNKLYLLMMLSVKHHSNGKIETPNKGLNVLGGQIGLGWNLQPSSQNKPVKKLTTNPYPINKKHQLAISVGYGRHEAGKEVNGPKYPVYVAALFAQKRINTLLMLNYGIEYVYFKSAYFAIIDNAIVQENPHWHASKISPYVGVDVLYGRFAITALIGFYPYKPILTAGRIPTKFGFKYFLYDKEHPKKNHLFIAGYLKTHFAVAEYLEFSVGWRLSHT